MNARIFRMLPADGAGGLARPHPAAVGFDDGWRSLYNDVRRRATQGHEIDRVLA